MQPSQKVALGIPRSFVQTPRHCRICSGVTPARLFQTTRAQAVQEFLEFAGCGRWKGAGGVAVPQSRSCQPVKFRAGVPVQARGLDAAAHHRHVHEWVGLADFVCSWVP